RSSRTASSEVRDDRMRSRSIPPEFTQAMAISTTVAAVIRRGTKYFISVPPSHKSLQSARETRPLFHERVRDQETAAREESPECCFLAAKCPTAVLPTAPALRPTESAAPETHHLSTILLRTRSRTSRPCAILQTPP